METNRTGAMSYVTEQPSRLNCRVSMGVACMTLCIMVTAGSELRID